MSEQKPKWKVKDVADYFNVKPSTVYRWVENDLLPVERTPGGHLRFDPDVIRKKEAPANG